MGLFKLRKKVSCEEYGQILAEEAFATIDQSPTKIWFSMLLDEGKVPFSSKEAQRIAEWIPFLRLFEVPLYFKACDKQIFSSKSDKARRQKIVHAFSARYQEKLLQGMSDSEKKECENRFMLLFPMFDKIEDVNFVPVMPSYPYVAPIALTEIRLRILDYAKKTGRLENGHLKSIGDSWIIIGERDLLPLAKTLVGNDQCGEVAMSLYVQVGMGIKLDLLGISAIMRTVGAKYIPKS